MVKETGFLFCQRGKGFFMRKWKGITGFCKWLSQYPGCGFKNTANLPNCFPKIVKLGKVSSVTLLRRLRFSRNVKVGRVLVW